MARPTKYSQALQDAADAYVKQCDDIASKYPTVEELAAKLDINDDTVVEWATRRYPADHPNEKWREKLRNPTFSATYKSLQALQRRRLQYKALEGHWNPAMSIFLLKANHGMIETSRQEVDQKTQHSGEITVNVVKYAGSNEQG